MNALIHFFGSGLAFFVGIALIGGSLTIRISRWRRFGTGATLLAVFGLFLVVLSAVPVPYWLLGFGIVVTIIWLWLERRPENRGRREVRLAVAASWLTALAIEIPYQVVPTPPPVSHPRLFVIGDSVSAGMGTEKETWPRILASRHSIEVIDHSRMGATAASALQQAERLPDEGGVVLIEIGGNDLLGETSSSAFAEHLEQLLQRVCRQGRTIVMLELPLIPFANEFGRAQRRLAARYGVALVPRRIFADVLAGTDATIDSIHLSRNGHELMAEVVWRVIAPAYSR